MSAEPALARSLRFGASLAVVGLQVVPFVVIAPAPGASEAASIGFGLAMVGVMLSLCAAAAIATAGRGGHWRGLVVMAAALIEMGIFAAGFLVGQVESNWGYAIMAGTVIGLVALFTDPLGETSQFGRCPNCDYSLAGLRRAQCPECGWTPEVVRNEGE